MVIYCSGVVDAGYMYSPPETEVSQSSALCSCDAAQFQCGSHFVARDALYQLPIEGGETITPLRACYVMLDG